MTDSLFLDSCLVAMIACCVMLIPVIIMTGLELSSARSARDDSTFQSDGDEIVILATPGAGDRYASVFLSRNGRRVGIRLHRPGHTIWMDSRIVPRLRDALKKIARRLP